MHGFERSEVGTSEDLCSICLDGFRLNKLVPTSLMDTQKPIQHSTSNNTIRHHHTPFLPSLPSLPLQSPRFTQDTLGSS